MLRKCSWPPPSLAVYLIIESHFANTTFVILIVVHVLFKSLLFNQRLDNHKLLVCFWGGETVTSVIAVLNIGAIGNCFLKQRNGVHAKILVEVAVYWNIFPPFVHFRNCKQGRTPPFVHVAPTAVGADAMNCLIHLRDIFAVEYTVIAHRMQQSFLLEIAVRRIVAHLNQMGDQYGQIFSRHIKQQCASFLVNRCWG